MHTELGTAEIHIRPNNLCLKFNSVQSKQRAGVFSVKHNSRQDFVLLMEKPAHDRTAYHTCELVKLYCISVRRHG